MMKTDEHHRPVVNATKAREYMIRRLMRPHQPTVRQDSSATRVVRVLNAEGKVSADTTWNSVHGRTKQW